LPKLAVVLVAAATLLTPLIATAQWRPDPDDRQQLAAGDALTRIRDRIPRSA
jgi:hypothetical protein